MPEQPLNKFPEELSHPSSEYSVLPFWFWNDDLDENELLRQMDDFQRHGVDGFVIHPRVGLPRNLGFLSERLLNFFEVVIEAARQRGMKVLLYDEGVYPSGSASGQVVEANPGFACRCLAAIDLSPGQEPLLKAGETLVALVSRSDGSRIAVIDRPANSVIRGLHYIDEGPDEDEPPAADILNPLAVAKFIELVYDRFASRFSKYFGSTILGIFTDEPGLLGRSREQEIWPGTTGILAEIERILGYDFTPHLPALWNADEPDAEHARREYERAISLRLEETYYQPLSAWCEAHGIALTGHPAKGDDIGPLRYFHIPGQDLVWRWVLPDSLTALEGRESTQAKCSASAMVNAGRRRNTNECCGAYGHEMTWEEMNWLARWAFARGVNMLTPHAFYYSVRGVRRDERPPDVGPNSSWWDRFGEYAGECRRLSWINTGSRQVCQLAILGQTDWLPWQPAKICFEHQYDFNYVEERDLLERAVVDARGIHLGEMTYTALIHQHDLGVNLLSLLSPLRDQGQMFCYLADLEPQALLAWLEQHATRTVITAPEAQALRARWVIKAGWNFLMLFNEEKEALDFTPKLPGAGLWSVYDAVRDEQTRFSGDRLHLDGYELKVLVSPVDQISR